MEHSPAFSKVVKARAQLIMSQPFFGSLAVRLEMIETSECKTLQTNGKVLRFNPQFVDGLSMPELIGCVAHEVMHVACLHHTRRGSRDAKKWNVAADHAINPLLIKSGFQLPADVLNDPAFHDKSAEAIYGLIPDPEPKDAPQSNKNGQGEAGAGEQGDPSQGDQSGDQQAPQEDSDPGGCGEVMDTPGEDGGPADPGEIAAAEADALVATVQAMNVAKAAGKLPAGFEQVVDDLKKAKVDWREELRRFMQRIAKDDYSWSRPNRRLISRKLYLPSLHSENMGPIVVAIDTSGSTKRWWPEFASEMSKIIEDVRPESTHFIFCDAEVQKVDVFTPDNPPVEMKPTFSGGGGTRFQPVFDYVEENNIQPDCLVFLTDLEGMAPQEPSYPVVWACTTDLKAPFGDLIEVRR
jgi:predicted metal-dependent peptidase